MVFQKTSHSKNKRHFQETISFDKHSTVNSPLKSFLGTFKFLIEKNVYFFQKKNILRTFSRILRQLCYKLMIKNFQGQKVSDQNHKSDIIIWQVRVKDVGFGRFEWMIFHQNCKYGCEKIQKKHYTNHSTIQSKIMLTDCKTVSLSLMFSS